MYEDGLDGAGWTALLSDVLGCPPRLTVLSALSRRLDPDTVLALDEAWDAELAATAVREHASA